LVSGFVRVLDASELPSGTATMVGVNGREIALVSVGGRIHAVDNVCPHEGGPLADGTVQGGVLVCPLHHWEFDVTTGRCLNEPDECVRRYETKVENGQVLVQLDSAAG